MSLLESILKGKKQRPRIVTLYGVPGIGKSTWAANAPDPVFIQTEAGLDDIGANRFPLCGAMSHVMECIEALKGEHSYKTVVLDSLSALEPMVWKYVCQKGAKSNIEDFGYGKGYILALDAWREVVSGLNDLHERGMSVIVIGHSKITRFNDPEGDAYDFYDLDINKHASSAVFRWSDEVLFANYKVLKSSTGEGLKKRVIAIDSDRVLHTLESPAFKAKNRLGMPAEIPFEYSEYAKYLKGGE